MVANMHTDQAQLHPLHRALKESWQRLVVNKKVKQAWLAARCEVDDSCVSRWINPNVPDFPPPIAMAQLIEALQEWPGVEKWEPLEAFNVYFGCHVAEMHRTHQPLRDLAGLLAITTGKALQLILQALSPDSDGGIEITEAECTQIRPAISALRRVADDLDDRVNGKGLPDLEAAQ